LWCLASWLPSGARTGLLTASLAAVCAFPATAQTRDLTGRVLSETDSTAITSVRVTVVETGAEAITDTAGRFSLLGLPITALHLALDRVGVRLDTVILAPGVTTVTLYAGVTAVQMRPFVATAARPNRERFETQVQPSAVTLQAEEISAVPTVGEPDVARVVQLLPGTVSRNDFSATYNVRGGEADQNLVRLDGITLFNPFHVGGMFSTFDAAAIGNVDFLTGAFPAWYPGRLSSVLDVNVRSGRNDRVGVVGMVSLLSAKLLVEGPIPGTDATFMIGGRRSWADAFVDGILSLTGYVGRDVGDTPWLDASSGQDPIDLEFDWGNAVAGLHFDQPLGRWRLSQRLSVTRFSTGIALVPDVFDATNKTTLWSAATDIGAQLGRHDVQFGVSVEPYAMTYRADRPALETVILDQAWSPTVWAGYVEDQWRPADWMFVRPGVRVEYVDGANETTVAPRLGVKAFVTEDVAINGSVGRYHQPIHSIRDQDLPVSFFEFWIGADSVTPIARSDQAVLGIEVWPREDLSITVEGYTKSFENLAMRNPADDFKAQGDEFFVARGYARGFEVLVRKHFGRFAGWVAYSFNDALRRA
jgi:hypothetical protein